MMKRDLVKKLGSLAISILLMTLIFFILIPPATAVELDPGTPSSVSVSKGTTITFTNVNLTIRAAEAIPVTFLNFSIFDSNNNYLTHVKFYINATEIEDPLGKFGVTNVTNIDNLPYNTGSSFGYDENAGENVTGFGYGYGYADSSYTDINVLYTITYTTHLAGTFYAKLFVNSSTHTYTSGESSAFTVNEYGSCDANWSYFKTITIDHSYIDTDLVNFSVLVNVSAAISAKCDDGDSIRFLNTDNTTEYYYEIEDTWNSSSYNFVWVNVTQISSSADTKFLMYYNNSGASDNQSRENVWDSGYKLVSHLNTSDSTTVVVDSTSGHNNGSKLGNAEPSRTTGNIGYGQNYDGDANQISYGNIGDTFYGFSVWIKPAAEINKLSSTASAINVRDSTLYSYFGQSTGLFSNETFCFVTSSNNTRTGIAENITASWHLLSVSWDGSQFQIYLDGVNLTELTYDGGISRQPMNNLILGTFSAINPIQDMDVDEFRVSTVKRNDSWMKTTFHSGNQTTGFLTWGGEQQLATPTVVTNASTSVEETTATLNGYLSDDGNLTTTCGFRYGTNSGTYTSNSSSAIVNEGNEFSDAITSLTQGQIYYCQAWANNAKGFASGDETSFLTKPDAPTSLTATASSSSQINLAWTNGTGANNTHIRRKTGSYPTSVTDGTEVYNGTGTSSSNTGLSASTKYYYRAWSYASWDSLHQWSDSYVNASATTSSAGGGGVGGGGGGYIPPTEEEEPTVKEEVETLYDVTLNENFYANDTDGDGVVDTFDDPNEILEFIRFAVINDNASFLISADGSLDELFIWDTDADTITQVTHSVGAVISTVTDADAETRTITISIEKANWTYIEVTDQHPDNDLIVKTADGRTISSDMIWRENNKIYVLDDPATEYHFIYSYEEAFFLFDVVLELIPTSAYAGENISVLITLINVGEPGLVNCTVNYTLYKGEEIIWSYEESLSVLGQIAFTKSIETQGLSVGDYIFEVVHYYGDNQNASAKSVFTVNEGSIVVGPPSEKYPFYIIIIILIILLVIIMLLICYKKGYLCYGEKSKGERKGKRFVLLLLCPYKLLIDVKQFLRRSLFKHPRDEMEHIEYDEEKIDKKIRSLNQKIEKMDKELEKLDED